MGKSTVVPTTGCKQGGTGSRIVTGRSGSSATFLSVYASMPKNGGGIGGIGPKKPPLSGVEKARTRETGGERRGEAEAGGGERRRGTETEGRGGAGPFHGTESTTKIGVG